MLAELVQLGAKVETTEGTYAAPAAGDMKFLVRNPTYKPIFSKTEREVRSAFFSTHRTRGPAVGGEIAFELDAYAVTQSALPIWMSILMAACRWGTVTGGGGSAAYVVNPLSTNNTSTVPSLSMSLNVDGFLHKLAGCRGTCKLVLKAGERIVLQFRFQGVHVTPTDTAFASVTYDTNADDCPVFVGAALAFTAVSPATDTFASSEIVLETLEIDLNNTLYLRPSANGSMGYLSCQIVGGMPTISLDPEWVPVATWSAIERVRDSALFTMTTGPLAGIAALNNIQIDAPRVEFMSVTREARGGIATKKLEGVCRGNAGNDELSFTLSA